MSFTDPGDFFQGRPGDSFQGRPGDTFDGGTFKARADARNAESHARHERWQQEKADRLFAEAGEQSRDDLAAMARNDARAFALALGQFRAMMEICFPALVRLCDQTTSPDSSELFPAVAALGQHGPCWQHPIPEGKKDNQVPVWSEADHAWLPGEVAGGYDGEFALYLAGNVLKAKKGTVFVNGQPCDFGDDVTVASVAGLGNATLKVYLCAYQSESPTEARAGIPVNFGARIETAENNDGTRGYIKLGEYSVETGIVQEYLGGSGAQIIVGLTSATDNMILKWNNNDYGKTWEPGWLTSIQNNQ